MSVGWSDVYGYDLDCQWLDITDIPPGNYKLVVSVNRYRVFAENSFENNFGTADVVIPNYLTTGTSTSTGTTSTSTSTTSSTSTSTTSSTSTNTTSSTSTNTTSSKSTSSTSATSSTGSSKSSSTQSNNGVLLKVVGIFGLILLLAI